MTATASSKWPQGKTAYLKMTYPHSHLPTWLRDRCLRKLSNNLTWAKYNNSLSIFHLHLHLPFLPHPPPHEHTTLIARSPSLFSRADDSKSNCHIFDVSTLGQPLTQLLA